MIVYWRREMIMRMIVKQMAIASLLCFSSYAVTIKVPSQQAKISAAVQASAAGDTIEVANGTYKDRFTIDHALTIKGILKDSCIITREGKFDSLPTVTITAKNVHLENLTITGHNCFIQKGEIDSIIVVDSASAKYDTIYFTTSWPASEAIVMSGAESVSISSCIILGGKGAGERCWYTTLLGASGFAAVKINKSSKYIVFLNDSITGGWNALSDSLEAGIRGMGIEIDTSSDISIKRCAVWGGDSRSYDRHGDFPKGGTAIDCTRGKNIIVDSSAIVGGRALTGIWHYGHAISATDSSDVSGTLLPDFTCGDINFEEGSIDHVPVYPVGRSINKKHRLTIDYYNGSHRSFLVTCVSEKPSSIVMDILNAKGQVVTRFAQQKAIAGVNRYLLNLDDMKELKLSSLAYFLRVKTDTDQRSFRLLTLQ